MPAIELAGVNNIRDSTGIDYQWYKYKIMTVFFLFILLLRE
jgi:hypothetical protein